MQHRRATGGLDWMDWISPGGVKYRAPYGANKMVTQSCSDQLNIF